MASLHGNRNDSFLKKRVVSFHQRYSHNDRVAILAHEFATVLKRIFPEDKEINALDVGCGDMQLVEIIHSLLPNTGFKCIDVFDPEYKEREAERWGKYTRFDGKRIPFAKNAFDVIVFSDVLHHDRENISPLLNEASRVANYIIVKDHFEYGPYSRTVLRLMDFIGNWGYDVSIPNRYFTKQSYQEMYSRLGLAEQFRVENIDIYRGKTLLKLFVRKRWQFISVLMDSNH